MRIRRIDGANWKVVRAEGFLHVDGDVYDVPTARAKELLKEQPERWEAASRRDRAKPEKSAKPAKPASPMSTEDRPELAGGGDEGGMDAFL